MDWKAKLTKGLEWPAKFLANGGHAQQDIPSQHRLLNAGGMCAGWLTMDYVRHAAFGVRQKSEGEYVDVKLEEVPLPLRFLHKTIDWDPHSETAENQWKKLAYQMLPGLGAGIGAVAGSMYAFERNGRAQHAKELKGLEKLNLLDADFAAQYAQSTALRALAAFFGTFSSASGLTFLYGFFLNPSFVAANGAKIFTGSLAKGNMAPHRAVEAQLGMLGSYVQEAFKTGKMNEAWADQFVTRVLEPMFGELHSPVAKEQAVKTIQGLVEKSYQRAASKHIKPAEAAKEVTEELTKLLGDRGLDATVIKELGLDPAHAVPGNANPALHQFQSFLNSVGLGTPVKVGKQAGVVANHAAQESHIFTTDNAIAAGSVGFTGGLIGASWQRGKEKETAASTANSTPHTTPSAQGKTAAEYVSEVTREHKVNTSGTPPDWLKWMGDGQLAVLPIHRMCCAIGLTSGLMIAGNMAKIATGYGLDGKAVEFAKVPTYLQGLYKIVKDYNPKGLDTRNRWIKYAQWGAYSLGGFAGIKLGSDYAYRNVHKKNKDPHYLEDYLPRVSMHQGDTWSWLSSFSGIFGSAAGLFSIPIPGINYGLSLAGRTTSMQDRNFMLPGLHGALSGSTTTSYLRLREGLNYLCHYTVGSPDKDPSQIEYLAYTLLGPIFKDELTADHIKRFTEAVHETRDQYWQEGGIPKEKRKEALATMKEVFTGPGLEVMLIDMGLNPGTIAFNALNGLTGVVGNLGAGTKIQKEQDDYHAALTSRLTKYTDEGLISRERAEWVKEGIEKMKRGEKPRALQPEPKEPEQAPPENLYTPSVPLPEKKTFTERAKKGHIETLIDRADNKGDWRTQINLEPTHDVHPVIGG